MLEELEPDGVELEGLVLPDGSELGVVLPDGVELPDGSELGVVLPDGVVLKLALTAKPVSA